jgi:hypothetical protein
MLMPSGGLSRQRSAGALQQIQAGMMSSGEMLTVEQARSGEDRWARYGEFGSAEGGDEERDLLHSALELGG